MSQRKESAIPVDSLDQLLQAAMRPSLWIRADCWMRSRRSWPTGRSMRRWTIIRAATINLITSAAAALAERSIEAAVPGRSNRRVKSSIVRRTTSSTIVSSACSDNSRLAALSPPDTINRPTAFSEWSVSSPPDTGLNLSTLVKLGARAVLTCRAG